jgi:hypothetical protein
MSPDPDYIREVMTQAARLEREWLGKDPGTDSRYLPWMPFSIPAFIALAAEALPETSGNRFLDIGAGAGTKMLLAREIFGLRVTGIEVSTAHLALQAFQGYRRPGGPGEDRLGPDGTGRGADRSRPGSPAIGRPRDIGRLGAQARNLAETAIPVSAPARNRPFLDQDNHLLAGVPARLDTGVIGLPAGAGNMGVLTVRTASTTVSVVMTAADLDGWARAVSDLAATVRAAPVLALPTAGETAALRNGGNRPPVA